MLVNTYKAKCYKHDERVLQKRCESDKPDLFLFLELLKRYHT